MSTFNQFLYRTPPDGSTTITFRQSAVIGKSFPATADTIRRVTAPGFLTHGAGNLRYRCTCPYTQLRITVISENRTGVISRSIATDAIHQLIPFPTGARTRITFTTGE